MKRFILLTLGVILLLPFSQVHAQGDLRIITVTGNAEVRVVPDEVLLTVGVETWNAELPAAKTENDRRVSSILALAEKFGIKPEHVQTDYISIQPSYRDYERGIVEGYFVRKTIVFILKDITQFETLLTEVIQSGATHIHNIEFRTTELRKWRDEARALAIRAAKEKATALTSELGQELGKVHSIQENSVGWWSSYRWWGGTYSGAAAQNVVQNTGGGAPISEDGSFAPGQIVVSASVTVSFELP